MCSDNCAGADGGVPLCDLIRKIRFLLSPHISVSYCFVLGPNNEFKEWAIEDKWSSACVVCVMPSMACLPAGGAGVQTSQVSISTLDFN